VLQPIVKFLVVAEVKTALLEFPLEVPVSLSDEEEAGILVFDGRNYINPIFR
jgi:hypothetical protein